MKGSMKIKKTNKPNCVYQLCHLTMANLSKKELETELEIKQ